MTDLHFTGLLSVAAVAFAAPFVLGLAPRLRLPSVVLEIVAGIVIGPSVLGWVHIDEPIAVLSLVGLAFLDAGEIASPFGQLVVAAGTIADFGAIIVLSLFFSGEGGIGSTLVLLGGLLGVAIAVLLAVRGAERSRAVMRDLVRLQDTTAQIRVRGAVVLMIGFVALAQTLGLEAILGAFAAGAILALVDRDELMTHPLFRRKLEAIGFGVFVPVFFVASGVRFDLGALLDKPSNLALVPIFLGALVVVRGIPALLYRGLIGDRRTVVAALLQSTSLPFIVAASAIGLQLDLLTSAQSSALIAAGLLSVLLFPVTGLAVLTGRGMAAARTPDADAEPSLAM